jgi:GAF domain-containing protein
LALPLRAHPAVRPKATPLLPARRSLLPATGRLSERIAASIDLASLLDNTMKGLEELFDIRHSMVLLVEGDGRRLYTVASRGYQESGVGSEIAIGCGVIGVAAAQRAPIRITHMTAEHSYAQAIRESLMQEGMAELLETAIPLPGLHESRSQLAVPVLAACRLLGVLYVESPEDMRFSYDDEDALVSIASQLGMAIHALQLSP